jgi:hypothetical protein
MAAILENPKPEQAKTLYGGPTKRFFVSMLTRDIDLDDAILDLIDNCVDGAMRSNPGEIGSLNPFAGFKTEIDLSKNAFKISDNCGGIPAEHLVDAFSLGRPSNNKDHDLPTIGMYGIGMKRAIFKIARSAVVTSVRKNSSVAVNYSEEWLDPENSEWDLPVTPVASPGEKLGVTITSGKLREGIGSHFANDAFLNRLKLKIGEHFGYIIQKGFSIAINGKAVAAATLPLLSSDYSANPSIRAFNYVAKIGDVDITVTIGFFRPLVREKEIDEETVAPTSREQAGISVICNDRVVLLHDRTFKTGWGEGGVPRFHPQFRAIAGIVVLASNNANSLPISTTKRDLDVGSEVFMKARQSCIEGIKIFTDFTNRWKGIEAETNQFFDTAPKRDARREIMLARDHGSTVRGMPDAKKFKPTLPSPGSRSARRISFVRELAEIEAVSLFLFDEKGVEPKDVGNACFDKTLKEARNG